MLMTTTQRKEKNFRNSSAASILNFFLLVLFLHGKVEEVEGSSSTSHHLHHSPDSGGSTSSPPQHRMMVDSTGVGPGGGAADSGGGGGAAGTAGGGSEGSASESSPRQSGVQSLATSREEDGEDAGPGTGAAGGGSKRDSLTSSDKSPGQSTKMSRFLSNLFGNNYKRAPNLSTQSRSKSVGEQKWQNLRAVMALYTRLRKIKRTKSNQRWMKLRTTVQLSGAITTIQKKPPLKREDSFLKRFSTRQIPETQETVDTGDDGDGGPSSQSTGSTRRRRRRRQQRLPRTVVNPDENFYFYWLLVLTICVLYNLWTLIVRQSFPELQTAAHSFWFTCDGFSDAVFLLDVVVQFRTGYLEQGLMVYDSKKLAGHYFRSKAFLLDLSALLPLDLLQINLGVNPILRFPRFLKVYRVYDYYYMVESRTVYPNLWRVVNLIHILLILAHWFGCFYYLLSEAEGFHGDWVYPYRPGDYATLTRKYLGSLYWSTLTLTTIGDLPTPETNADTRSSSPSSTSSSSSSASSSSSSDGPHALPRRGLKSRLLQFSSNRGYVFTIVSYLIGVFIFATIVGQVGNVITNRNANRLEFERLLDGAKTYMRHHKVPGGMKRRVLRWYDYSWSRGRIQGGGDINTALGLLPDKLKTELALHVNLSVLKKVTIFQECQPEFLHDLVLKMKAYIFTPGDLICRKGEVAREMFIIADGILEVISETGRVLTTMKAGDFFGEIGILNLDGLNKRTADVRSVGYSELFSLSREDVLAAMKDYPEAQEILQSLGRKRLMEARNVSRAKAAAATVQTPSQDAGAVKSGKSSAVSSPLLKESMSIDADGRAGKRIVERLRSDVKGLKNALRKSRRGARTKDESMELQPLNPSTGNMSTSGSKGMLRRMSRVHSDENYSREESVEDQQPPSSAPPTAKLGEGLPLLQRLRLLKEKQDREEQNKTPTSPSVQAPPELEPVQEVIGAGLPLIQRLLLLKQKEERERQTMQTTAAVTADVLASTVRSQQQQEAMSTITSPKGAGSGVSDDSRHSSSKEHSEDESATTSCGLKKSTVRSRLASVVSSKSSSSSDQQQPSTSTGTSKVPLREKLKLFAQRDSSSSSSTVTSPPPTQAQVSAKTSDSDSSIGGGSGGSCPPAILKKQQSWMLLKRASILSSQPQGESSAATSSATTTTMTTTTSPIVTRTVDSEKAADASEGKVLKKEVAQAETAASDGQVELRSLPEGAAAEGSALVETETSSAITVTTASMTMTTVTMTTTTTTATTTTSTLATLPSKRPKPSLLRLQQDTKFYTSIDDLSPEYSGLPFVKKLKILNERQKLAELEQKVAVVYMRSSSLDSAGAGVGAVSGGGDSSGDLTRSHSEATAMQYVRNQQLRAMQVRPPRPSQLPEPPPGAIATSEEEAVQSPESNETLERRNLKSILKKLSASSLFSGSGEDVATDCAATTAEQEPPPVVSAPAVDMRKLMRAPTIEGYAARHSKLTKSVTFNRDTLQSPPAFGTEGDIFLRTDSPVMPSKCRFEAEMETPQPPPPPPPPMPPEPAQKEDKKPQVPLLAQHSPQIPLSANQKNFFRPSLLLPSHTSLEEEYFSDVITGIKHVIQGHLEDIQNKFQSQFQSLELEVKKRDEIISQLQKRIHELEHPKDEAHNEEGGESDADEGSDQPFMVRNTTYMETVPWRVLSNSDSSTLSSVSISRARNRHVRKKERKDNYRGDSVDTVLASPPPTIGDDDLDEEDDDEETERPYQQLYRHSWEDHSEEETMELLDLPRSISPLPADSKDCVALDLGSSNSSSSSSSSTSSNDVDDAFALEDELHSVEHNRDWEVQMLARELERREGITRLENEVRDLKAAVSSSDLSRLTKSELDILEQVLVAEDRKVKAAARAFSLDSDDSVTEGKDLRDPPTQFKEELKPTSLSSSALHKQKLIKQRSTNGGGSIENLIHKTSLLKNRLLSATAKRHQLLNARSLDETPETSTSSAQAVSSVASGTTVPARSRSASSGSITPVGRSSAFPFSFVKGLGNLVRNSSGSSSAQHSRHSSISPDGSAVPTISRTCGTVSPNSSHQSDDPSGPNL